MRKETYLFIGISIAVLIVSLVFVFNYKIIVVSGESMRPEYNDGQIVLADRSFSKEDILVGDIVVSTPIASVVIVHPVACAR